MKVTHKDIDIILKDDNWGLMNKLLYQMCSKYPEHTDTSTIMAKICLIGRSYSASIERRKIKDEEDRGDDFYEKTVAPEIMESKIDHWLCSLKEYRNIAENNLGQIIETHSKVMKLFNRISGLNKRSLASKYLHFHLPNLFYIYDSRAIKGLRVISDFRINNQFQCYDVEYSKFVQKLFYLHNKAQETFGITLSTRQLDRLLLLKSRE